MIDLDELERLAEAAHDVETDATWEECDIDNFEEAGIHIFWACTVEVRSNKYHVAKEGADTLRNYIAAANPAVVLELIAEVRRLREVQQ